MKSKYYVSFFVLILFTNNAFSKNSYTLWQNEKIDSKVKTEISAINKKVYSAMSAADFKTLASFLSDTLKKSISSDFESKFLPQIQTVIKGKEYRIYDEFYITNAMPDSLISFEGGQGENKYIFEFAPTAKQSYISLLVSGDNSNEVMLTLVYIYINGQWKISIIRGEDYSLGGKNAIEIFNLAYTLKKTGDFIDASNMMAIASHCANPGGLYFKYNLLSNLKDYIDTLNFETMQKYTFPYTIEKMKTKPQVFNIHLELVKGLLTPMIVYQTSIYIKDTIALKVENDEFHSKLGTIFTGMDKNNKSILYRTYNEKPNGQNTPGYFGFMKNIE